MAKRICMVMMVTVVLGGTAMSDTPPRSPKTISPTKWTCADFLSFDEATRPQIVYWSEGFRHKEKTASVAFDVDRINSLVPQLIADCTKEPHASYWAKMKRRFSMD